MESIKNFFLILLSILGVVLVGIMSGGRDVSDFKLKNRLARRKNEIDALKKAEDNLQKKVDAARISDKTASDRLQKIKTKKRHLKEELTVDRKNVEAMSDENLLNSVNDMLGKL